jgi:hypothetical protein
MVEEALEMKPVKVESPVTVSVPLWVALPEVKVPKDAVVAKRLVEEAVVAKELVVVACVPVALTKVKFWSVEEPVARMFANVASPFPVMVWNVAPWVALNCPPTVEDADVMKPPVRVARPLAVSVLKSAPLVAFNCPPIVEEPMETRLVKVPVELTVSVPVVRDPKEALVEKRLVEELTLANSDVLVALVVVAFAPVKFWSVEEPLTNRFERVARFPVKLPKVAPLVALN